MQSDLISESGIADFYKGKKILVVGGTGSVGEKMVEKLLKLEPAVVRIFSRDEFKQYELAVKHEGERRLRYLIGDVRDYERLERAATDIDVIFNLAALKHVPACEYNPFEAVKTNVIGTQNIINTAISRKVSTVVFTSSDKAINPTNAMGATKLLGERLMIAAEYMKGGVDASFAAVRFGNVLGSRGSVIPLFVKQIRERGEISVTDPTMTRFMMSVEDAASLTLKAAAAAKGGEIFVLKMPNIKISDLVSVVVELVSEKYGIRQETVTINEVGLRTGEKMYEELMTELESKNAYEMPGMYAILPDSYKHRQIYADIPQAKAAKYSSNETETLSREAVKELLIKENLI